MPEQSMHKNTPYEILAQLGFLAAQSKHTCSKPNPKHTHDELCALRTRHKNTERRSFLSVVYILKAKILSLKAVGLLIDWLIDEFILF